ncbi:caspase family protein [Brevundimonas sp.]|uniref:caspase family protein n=1 Tax=Brevundimonas sp. TaxID=1871086 RepID=UPI003BAC7DBF
MRKTILLATTAFVLCAGAAIAQQRLQPGATVSGDLRQGDERLQSGEFLDAYEFQGRAGDQVSLRMTSQDFDTYLMVSGPGDFSDENDDAVEGDTSAGMNLRLPATGAYRVTATSYEPGESGRYQLDFRGGAGGGTAAVFPTRTGGDRAQNNRIAPGDTMREALGQGDVTLSTGEYADAWRFQARRGQTYTLTLQSSDFDPYLVVRAPGGFSQDNDDDPGSRGSTDSRISFTAQADGEVTISATSYSAGETGRYALSLSESSGGTQASSGGGGRNSTGDSPIRVGETRDGQLGQGARQLSSGEYINSFTLTGRRGQRLDLTMTSSDFDPFVQIEGPNGFSAFNDDDAEAGGSNSRLIVTLPSDGAYEVMATSYAANERGRYRLSVRDGAGYQAPPPRPGNDDRAGGETGRIAIGDTVGGTLQAGDDTLDSGEYVDNFTFQGQRGQRVAVELTSSAFDAYTILTTPSGEQIDNDDGEDGTNSRLDTVLSESGEYSVAVTSFSAGETGSYRFSVTPSEGPQRQASVQGGPRVFAIMVGVSDYGDDQANLPYTDEDAQKLAETLRREGVLNPASVTLTNAQATVAGVRQAFQRVAQQAGPDDMFLFFFSGHGDQTDGAVSATEPDGKTESIVLRDGEISDDEMADLFGTLRTRLSLLVLDSCYSGGFARNVVDRPGVMGLFSSEEDLTSAVADKFEAGGYLAHFLRAGLSGSADTDGDRIVTAGELATYLRRQFRDEVESVEAETSEGQRNYQNLVIDRGGVQIDDVIVRLSAEGRSQAGGR